MFAETQTTDGTARVSLPVEFANATIVIERLSDTELRVRRSTEEDLFAEERRPTLSEGERDRFLDLLENPPPLNPAFIEAATRYKARRD